MNRLANERLDIKKFQKNNVGTFLFFTIVVDVLLLPFSFDEYGNFFPYLLYTWTITFVVPSLIFFLIIKKNSISLKRNDKAVLLICAKFLEQNGLSESEKIKKMESLFSAYPSKAIQRFLKKNKLEKIEIYKPCRYLADQIPKIRYFAIYSLMDMASNDGLYSLKEEEFIDEVRKRLNIHSITFQQIKNAYLKKGLKEERKILEEQAQRAFEDSFVPFNAYHVLGVSPDITFNQLKIRYRQLAKQYHPDRYVGKKDINIEEIEDKFNEITLAYKIILKHIQSS